MTKNTQHPKDENAENEYAGRRMAFHPYNIFMTLVLLGVTMLFIAFSAAYIYTRYQNDVPTIEVPNIFIFNTFILIASSFSIHWANKCYLNDDTKKYQLALLVTIGFLQVRLRSWSDGSAVVTLSSILGSLWLLEIEIVTRWRLVAKVSQVSLIAANGGIWNILLYFFDGVVRWNWSRSAHGLRLVCRAVWLNSG